MNQPSSKPPFDMPADAVQITGAAITPIALERVDRSGVDEYIVITFKYDPFGPDGEAGATRPLHLSAPTARGLIEALQRNLDQLDRALKPAARSKRH